MEREMLGWHWPLAPFMATEAQPEAILEVRQRSHERAFIR